MAKESKIEIEQSKLSMKHQATAENPAVNSPMIKLISGKDCCGETAFAEFLATKNIFKKTDGVQFYHYTQSFRVGSDISPQTAHEIAMEFAKENYKGFEVLIATHKDADHLHSHFIINSVSFEDGKKLHQSPDTIRKLRLSSDNICKAHGQEVLPTYTYGRSQTMSRAEKRATQNGTSWKRKLAKDIDICMSKSNGQEGFVFLMESLGYRVNWSDARKNITYTTADGMRCRDDRFRNPKYLKVNMEQEFDNRQQQTNDIQTGWEYQSATVAHPMDIKGIGKELLWQVQALAYAADEDDELQQIMEIAMITTLSVTGVCLLVCAINNQTEDKITDDFVRKTVDDLLQEPENQLGYEDEITEEMQEERPFTMNIGGC